MTDGGVSTDRLLYVPEDIYPYYNKFWLEAQHPAGLPFRLMPKLQ